MSAITTVSAWLDIEIFVTCPNPECSNLIDLLSDRDTDWCNHNDDGDLLRQVFLCGGDNKNFECDDVTCTNCKTNFNVRDLKI